MASIDRKKGGGAGILDTDVSLQMFYPCRSTIHARNLIQLIRRMYPKEPVSDTGEGVEDFMRRYREVGSALYLLALLDLDAVGPM